MVDSRKISVTMSDRLGQSLLFSDLKLNVASAFSPVAQHFTLSNQTLWGSKHKTVSLGNCFVTDCSENAIYCK